MPEITWNDLINSIDDATVKIATDVLHTSADCLPPEVAKAYRGEGVTFVLGAGVSKSCGVPSWPELLLRLHAQSLSIFEPQNVENLTTAYVNAIAEEGPLVSARIAAAGLKDDELREQVRAVIYGTRPKASSLLETIAKLSNACEGEGRIRSVLTYNYDTLLEDELQRIGREFDRKDSQDRGTGRGLPVRHVHGFLTPSPSQSEWIVLTEKQYHSEYGNPYSWSNVVQLNAFRETTCLFIGLSMSDPNLRRLLESSRTTATPKHYAFLRKGSISALRQAIAGSWQNRGRGMGRPKESELTQVDKRLQLLCDLADSNRASALQELGVDVVWYSSHEKLSELVLRIRNAET